MPKQTIGTPAIAIMPERLRPPDVNDVGCLVTLSGISNSEFKDKFAVVCSTLDVESGRVVVLVLSIVDSCAVLGSKILVRPTALATVETSATTPWWNAWFVKGAARPTDVALINSKRIRDLLDAHKLPPPVVVVVEPHPKAERYRCHANVAELAGDYNATPVYGYCMFPSFQCQCVTFEAHSVLKTKDGRLIDITPDWEGQHLKYFVEDAAFRADQFTKITPIYGNVQPSPVVTACGMPVLHCGCKWCNLKVSELEASSNQKDVVMKSPKAVTREKAKQLVAWTENMPVFCM